MGGTGTRCLIGVETPIFLLVILNFFDYILVMSNFHAFPIFQFIINFIASASGLFTIAFPLIFVESMRKRVKLLDNLLYSFDRPEDKPHTVRLAFSQQASMYMSLIALALIYQYSEVSLDLLAVPLLITDFGDGLAEPMGVSARALNP